MSSFKIDEKNIRIFTHEKLGEIRTAYKDGKWWFVVKDIASAARIVYPADKIRRIEGKNTELVICPGKSGRVIIADTPTVFELLKRQRKKDECLTNQLLIFIDQEIIPALKKEVIVEEKKPATEMEQIKAELGELKERFKAQQDLFDALGNFFAQIKPATTK